MPRQSTAEDLALGSVIETAVSSLIANYSVKFADVYKIYDRPSALRALARRVAKHTASSAAGRIIR
jgi:hypothetical protein